MQESLREEPPGGSTAAVVAARHFAAALRGVRPSVSRADRALYERLRDKLVASRSHIVPDTAPQPAARSAGEGAEGVDGPDESGMEVVTGGGAAGAGDDSGAAAGDGLGAGGGGAEPMEL